MQLPTRKIRIDPAAGADAALNEEWLVTNGLGGYASGTVANVPTRRYHGLLISALPAPLGRAMMLNYVSEQIRLPNGRIIRLGGLERNGGPLEISGLECLREFAIDGGLPTWIFQVDGFVIEKQLFMTHEQNTVYLRYRLLQGEPGLRLKLRPALQFRGHDQMVSQVGAEPSAIEILGDQYEFIHRNGEQWPRLRLYLHGHQRAFTAEPSPLREVLYRAEQRRGYPAVGDLWSPGYFRATLTSDQSITLVASTEQWKKLLVLTPVEALAASRERFTRVCAGVHCSNLDPIANELVLAADQFIITPAGRAEERERARALGEDVRTVIAGYHWFTDWGRDTMISLEGLALVTGRFSEAASILKTFGHYVRDGLIPNLFPEGEREGLYHTADASLWFFHAVDRYLAYAEDKSVLKTLLPTLIQIYEAHLHGTRFGIGVDPADGLLRQGAEGYQLTWMDAKVGDWVVTPRRGKAVETNALWYNALRLLEGWLRDQEQTPLAEKVAEQAVRVQRSFNDKFWNSTREGLFDVIDGPSGNDPACRPNQIFSFSLHHPVLNRDRWQAVLNVVQERLLTPVGLRSLAPGHPDYKPQYFGDLRARDAAYHQGTIWGWLIGPFIDAWMRVHPNEPEQARTFLEGFDQHLSQACIGSISEVFDAESPYHARGCIAQAWSVAEVLRAFIKTGRDYGYPDHATAVGEELATSQKT